MLYRSISHHGNLMYSKYNYSRDPEIVRCRCKEGNKVVTLKLRSYPKITTEMIQEVLDKNKFKYEQERKTAELIWKDKNPGKLSFRELRKRKVRYS